MKFDVILPNLGFGMEEGQVLAWLKQPGDSIRKGEPLVEVESDKASVELEALVDGTLDEILVAANTVAAVGSVLARIRLMDAASQPETENRPNATPLAQRVAREHGVDLSTVSGTGPKGNIVRNDVVAALNRNNGTAQNGKVLAVPAVRKLAKDLNIDLTTIRATGPIGQITHADLEFAIESARRETTVIPAQLTPIEPVLEGRREIHLGQMRKAIARRLSQSMQEAPHFYVTAELDLTAALKALSKDIGLNSLLLYVTILTLRDLPELNATYEDGRLYQYDSVNLAVAVALDNGLISPVLHRAEDYSLSGLAARSRDLVTRARAGKLRQDELSGGTFTVSNLGMIKQVDRFTAIINPPQVAILAVGAAKERPFVINGGLHVRQTAHLTVSADHRVIDGWLAARFLEAFDQHLQNTLQTTQKGFSA